MNIRKPLILVLGAMLLVLGGGMYLPVLADLQVGNEDWHAFALSGFITIFCGGALTSMGWGSSPDFSRRDALAVTVLAWIILPLFASIPLVLGALNMSITDALFESMSGLTTTGATVLSGLDHMPPGILLWRAMLNWIGGIGILATAVAILPALQVGGLEIFRIEFTANMTKVLPRIGELSAWIISIYLGLTISCMVCYALAGMGGFDALVHALTTVSTGGFSSSDYSMGRYVDNINIQLLCMVFMLSGALPFLAYIQLLRGNARAIFEDPQVRALLVILTLLIVTMTVVLSHQSDNTLIKSFILAGVNIISIMTGTGYSNDDFDQWGSGATLLFLAMIFVGGCAGSTCCGVKIFRYQIVFAHLQVQVQRLIYPSGVFEARYAGKKIEDRTTRSVFAFMLVFFSTYAISATALSLVGLDPITAISGAATTLANVGPGVGPVIGPSGNFSTIPDLGKWIMTATMYAGRLEIITILAYVMAVTSRH